MNNLEVTKIGHAGCGLGKLQFLANERHEGTTSRLTSCKLFVAGFDLVT